MKTTELSPGALTGKWGPAGKFNLKGAISIADSVTKGTDLTIKVSKWSAGDITRVTVNGADMYTLDDDGNPEAAFETQEPEDDGTAEFKVRVGDGALLGEQTLVLYTGTDKEQAGQKNINVIGIGLTVSPSTAVVGREVTVTGSGFKGNVTSIKVGEANVCATAALCDIAVASGGRVVAAFDVPDHASLADADDYSIVVSDDNGRTGSAMLTIPERTITVNPMESRIGSTIELSGTGWPTGIGGVSLVEIWYETTQLTTATADSSGEWSVGTGEDNVTMEADHKTPDAVVTLSSVQAQRGTSVTVSGANFHTYRPVMIEIAGSEVTPSGTTTDADGSFSTDVLVPGLSLGNKNLRVTVNDVPVVEFLEIVATPVSTTMTSEEAFADLVAMDNLIVVWYFDNDTKGWSFYDPRPEVAAAVDLNMVSSGDNVWIQITADQMFQGDDLKAGWNLVTLN